MVECSICGKVFKYESECRRHELSHLPRYNCDCGKKFTYLSALRRHQKQHERTGSIECDKCNHSFKDEALLKRHIKYAHDGTHICTECKAKFNSNQALSIHKLTHKPKSERKYICSFKNCNKTFNFSHQLKYHEMTHTDTKQYFCKTCGKGFIQAHNLKVHMKTHEPSKWLPCEIIDCKKKFSSEYARKKHYARHKKPVKENKLPDHSPNTTGHQIELTIQDNLCNFNKEVPVSPFSQEHQNRDGDNKIIKKLDIQSLNRECQKDLSPNNLTDPDDLTTCKAILGKCLVTGDTSTSENCLCDQMAKSNHDSNTTLKVRAVNDINELFTNTVSENSTKTTNCEDCSCNSSKLERRRSSTLNKMSAYNFCLPDFDYGKNGTVKIINTADIDFEETIGHNNNNDVNVTRKIDIFVQANDSIPYNSCKAVLGKCIVSENGMMNEDCLCAKMSMEEPQMTSQEIEEITPQYYDNSCMCL